MVNTDMLDAVRRVSPAETAGIDPDPEGDRYERLFAARDAFLLDHRTGFEITKWHAVMDVLENDFARIPDDDVIDAVMEFIHEIDWQQREFRGLLCFADDPGMLAGLPDRALDELEDVLTVAGVFRGLIPSYHGFKELIQSDERTMTFITDRWRLVLV